MSFTGAGTVSIVGNLISGASENEVWDTIPMTTTLCDVDFTSAGVLGLTPADLCPTCQLGIVMGNSNAAQQTGDCTQVGYAPGADGHRSPARYSVNVTNQQTGFGDGELWYDNGGVWVEVGVFAYVGDINGVNGANYTYQGTHPDPLCR